MIRMSMTAVLVPLAVLVLLGVALADVPRSEPVRDRVDVLEVNHYFGPDGEPVFDQLIAWTWDDVCARYQVVCWRMVKATARPTKCGNRWRVCWFDSEIMREVTAPSFRETWTQYDPEIAEREVLPEEFRRGLTKRSVR